MTGDCRRHGVLWTHSAPATAVTVLGLDRPEGVDVSKAIKWAWRYHSLGAEVFDTLDEAIRSAIAASDNGDEALQCIEHDGELIDWDHPLMQAEEDRRDAEYDARPIGPTVAVVEAIPPGESNWVMLGSFETEENAERYAANLRAIAGADRVRVSPRSQG